MEGIFYSVQEAQFFVFLFVYACLFVCICVYLCVFVYIRVYSCMREGRGSEGRECILVSWLERGVQPLFEDG